jgi:hypothetical protein
MHTNYVYDELRIVGKLVTRKITSYGEKTRSNQIGRCKVCKGLSSLRQ